MPQRLKKRTDEFDDPSDVGLQCDGVRAAATWVNPTGTGTLYTVQPAPQVFSVPDFVLFDELQDREELVSELPPTFFGIDE